MLNDLIKHSKSHFLGYFATKLLRKSFEFRMVMMFFIEYLYLIINPDDLSFISVLSGALLALFVQCMYIVSQRCVDILRSVYIQIMFTQPIHSFRYLSWSQVRFHLRTKKKIQINKRIKMIYSLKAVEKATNVNIKERTVCSSLFSWALSLERV